MRLHLPTLVAIAVVAFAIANVAHESGGHGVACMAVGAKLKALNAVYCDCDKTATSALGARLEAMAGSLANIVVAALAFALLRARRGRARGALDVFLWVLFAVDVLQPAGYLLFSGVMNVGDWSVAIEGLPNRGALRLIEAVVGAALYYSAARAAAVALAPFVNAAGDRVSAARKITLTSYVAGGALYAAAGLLNPLGGYIFLISALAAGFGGTSALAWCAALLKSPKLARARSEPLDVPASPPWIAAAVVAAFVFVVVLGRTITLG